MSGEQNLRRHFIAHVSVAQHLRRHFAALCRYKSVTSYRLSLSLGTFVVLDKARYLARLFYKYS